MALLSRVAESLFWLGRHIERAENTARLLDVAYHGRLEPNGADELGALNTWEALTTTLGLNKLYVSLHGEFKEEAVVDFLTVNSQNGSSIVSCLAAARDNAKGVRDYLSSETFVAINRLYHATAQRNLHLILADGIYDYCDTIRRGCQAFHGTAESTCLHDEGWYWLRSGVFLERADMVSRIVDSKYHLLMTSLDEIGGPIDRFQWAAVLRGVSGYEAFRRTHGGSVDGPQVVEFLVLEEEFPRSLHASVAALQRALDMATEGAEARLRNPSMGLVAGLRSRLQYESTETLLSHGLHEFLADAQQTLALLSRQLGDAFFGSAADAA
ncbi:MAG: alpha-E domain-containing protein [Anaerolineaceae bacterium]